MSEMEVHIKKEWKTFLESWDYRDDSRKIWKVINRLDGKRENKPQNESILIEGKEIVQDKGKANAFINNYAKVSNLKLNKEDRKMEKENRALKQEWRSDNIPQVRPRKETKRAQTVDRKGIIETGLNPDS